MEYRRLGRSGLLVSELCMGTMQFGWTADEPTAHHILDRAVEAGLNFIDTANVYSRWVEGNAGGEAERIVGNWLANASVRREDLILATKVRGRMGEGPNEEGLTRHHILASAQASLRRLRTDYLDLYQLHYPDEDVPIDETLDALNDLVHRGDVRYIGVSNFPAWRVVEALWTSERCQLASFTSSQPHYNLVHRREFEGEQEAVCRRFAIAVLPYSPLAEGFLTGKYARGVPPPANTRGAIGDGIQPYLDRAEAWRALEVAKQVAQGRGISPSQVALAWLLDKPIVTSPIIGPRSLEQFEDNLGAVELTLVPEEVQALESASAWGE